MALTDKQEAFVREYLVDLNATQAAARAGYSAKTAMEQGYQLLRKTPVQEAIQKSMQKRAEAVEISAEWVLEQLRGNHAIARKTGELTASNKSLELIGKHIGMFKDKVEVSGNDGGPLRVIFNIPRPPKDDDDDG